MNKKLKHVEKGDWIALVNGQGEIFPWQVTHIAFKNKQVWDMELMNQKGERKAFSFLDEEMEVTMSGRPKPSNEERYEKALFAILNIASETGQDVLIDIVVDALGGFELMERFEKDVQEGINVYSHFID